MCVYICMYLPPEEDCYFFFPLHVFLKVSIHIRWFKSSIKK